MRRAVVTGIGMCVPGGIGREKFWKFITSGETATRTISLFDASGFRSRIAAEVDWDPLAVGFTEHDVARFDRLVQFALFSLEEALADSGLAGPGPGGPGPGGPGRGGPGVTPERVGVCVGTAIGATMRLDSEYVAVSDHGRRWLVDHERAAPWLFDYHVPSSAAREIAWRVGAEGPALVVSTGCTSGMESVGHAAELIAEGAADVVITGASDAPISPITSACFDAIKATSPNNDDPAHACRPFDRNRDGFVLGEGAAILVLEDYEHARRRGARIYAELAGFATRCNAYHMTGLTAHGREMAEAILVALGRARAAPCDLDYVNAHGSGTRQNDRHETAAIRTSLRADAYRVPVSSIKAAIGHALGSVGAIELATCALAIERGVIPPTATLVDPDPECDLDYVPRVSRAGPVGVALSVASGFGGFQSAAVLRAPAERGRREPRVRPGRRTAPIAGGSGGRPCDPRGRQRGPGPPGRQAASARPGRQTASGGLDRQVASARPGRLAESGGPGGAGRAREAYRSSVALGPGSGTA